MSVADSEVAEAVRELHEYLSDRLAPLMVADSMALLLQQPISLMATELGSWAGQQHGVASSSDLLYHCVRKVSLVGEFDLLPREALAQSLRQLSQAVLQYCPEGERELLSSSLRQLGNGPGAGLSPTVSILHRREPEPPVAVAAETTSRLSQVMTTGLRRLSLFLERLRPTTPGAAASAEQRQEVAAQFVTTAAAESKTAKELDERLAPLKELGLVSAPDQVFRTLAGALAGWGALPDAEGAAQPLGAASELQAMRQIVSLADDPAEGARRFRELVHSAVEQFNDGNLGRAAVMFDLAEQLAAEQRVKPAFAEPLRTSGHQYLDGERLRKYAERQDCRRGLQRVLSFYTALQPHGLLDALDGEPSRDRRHQLLALLEVHGAPARAAARERLRAYVEGKTEVDAFFPMNLIYLLRAIPRPDDVSVEEEVQLVTKAPGSASPLPIVKQVIAYLSYTRHDKAERALITFLRVFETMLLQPEKATYSPKEVESLLDRTCVALARYGTPRAWQALVDHGLQAEARLGSTLARMAEAGKSQNLAASPEVVGRLLAALNAELPKTVLGLAVRRTNEERIVFLMQALSGTPIPAVVDALQEIVDKHPGQRFAEEAFRVLSTLKATTRPADTGASLAGDLELFGLPDVLQTLAGSQATGVLTLMDGHARAVATLLLENGRLRGAQCQSIDGPDAVYQLFEKPFKGTFAFVARRDHLGGEGLLPAVEVVALIFEGVRRHDELKRAAALVPDGVVLRATGQPWSPLADENAGFAGQVWASAAGGGTPEGCEELWATDSYRVRRLLAHWVEEGALSVVGS